MEKQENRKSLQGVVVSNKMERTIVVAVERSMKHPLYGKILRKTKRYKAHDEKNECQIGDAVRIMECRPLSKDKRFRVMQITKRAK
jgi:small subunit ribosomal protein S17